MPLEQLPEELLLTIAHHLPDSGNPNHLKSLSLTCRKLLPIAQEALFTTARLTICCGCHPKVNALIKLLRTVLARPDLAAKVRLLRFRAVRKRVEKLYAEQGFELLGFRDQCIAKLEELGYPSNHAWWRSINNCVESSFGGLLLALLPNLTDLDFWVKDHQRGPPSSECISGLWGGASPPRSILSMWKNVKHFTTGDTSMLKCGIDFDKLTTLDLRTVSIGTVLRLNGPGSLQGAENVVNLLLTVSIQFADRPLAEKAEIAFSDLLDALNCRAVKNLKITFINDGYHIGDDLTTELSAGYFLNQLQSVEKLLETLSISLETTEDDGELDWLIDMCQHPPSSMRGFASLISLVLPHSFLFNKATEDSCKPRELPPNLEQLELLYPHEDVEEWAEGFVLEKSPVNPTGVGAEAFLPNFRKLTLTCRDDAGIGAHYFTEDVNELWWTLSASHSIEAEVRDQLRGETHNLAGLYHDERIEDEDNSIYDDSSNEGNRSRTSQRIGPRGTVCEDVRLQTDILAFTRDIYMQGDEVSVNEIAEYLSVDKRRIRDAIRALRNAGNVLAPSDPNFHGNFEISFIRVNEALHERLVAAGEVYEESDDYGGEDDWEDDDGDTDEDMPDLEAFDPSSGVTIGPAIAPLSRVGMVTETAVLRFVRQCGPAGVPHEEIAAQLGTHYTETILRVGRLERQGLVREDEDAERVYFVRENTELREEDLS